MNDDDDAQTAHAQTLPQTLPPKAARRTARNLDRCGARHIEVGDLQQDYALAQIEASAGLQAPPTDPDEFLAHAYVCIARKSRAGIDIDDAEHPHPIEIPDSSGDPLLVLTGIEELEAQEQVRRARAGTEAGYLAEVMAGGGDAKSNTDLILRLVGSRAVSARSRVRLAQQFIKNVVERANGPQRELFDAA